MLRKQLLVFLFGTAIAIVPSFGLIIERSADVPATWNVAPSLEVKEKISVDPVRIENTQTINVEKDSRFSNAMQTKELERLNPRGTGPAISFRFLSKNVENETKVVRGVKNSDVSFAEASDLASDPVTVVPRNVVLLLNAENSQPDEELWKDFRTAHSFPVEGFLQNCYNNEPETTRFSLDDGLVSGSKAKQCECEHLLNSILSGFLSWARHVKGMATAVLSGTNFRIPSPVDFEGPLSPMRDFDELDESSVKPDFHKINPEIHSGWRLINLDKPISRPSTLAPTSNAKEGIPKYENMWDMFNVFPRIRIALFRTLVETLDEDMGGSEDALSSRKSRSRQSNLAEVVGNTIKELKSAPNEKGYVVVAVASGNELANAFELLELEASEDTLLVVAGVCSQDGRPVPFFAKGPSVNALREATTIWELPTVIRNVMAGGCQGSGCRMRPSFPFAQLRFPRQKFLVHRRSVRDKETAENSKNATKGESEASVQLKQTTKNETGTTAQLKEITKKEIPSTAQETTKQEISTTAEVKEIPKKEISLPAQPKETAKEEAASTTQSNETTKKEITSTTQRTETAKKEIATTARPKETAKQEAASTTQSNETTRKETTSTTQRTETAKKEIATTARPKEISKKETTPTVQKETAGKDWGTKSGMARSMATYAAAGKLTTALATAMSVVAAITLSTL